MSKKERIASGHLNGKNILWYLYFFWQDTGKRPWWDAMQDYESKFKPLSQQDAPPHLSLFKPTKKSRLYKKSFTVGCIESRWTLKHKPEVKVLTLMHVVLNSWALFLPSFCKSSPGVQCSSIYQSRPHPSAAGRYNWHSSYQKSLQDSHSMRLALSCADFAIPPSQYPVRPGANADLHLAIWRWKKGELAPPSSESRSEMEFFFILFPFPHITSGCQIPYYAKPSQELGCAHGG